MHRNNELFAQPHQKTDLFATFFQSLFYLHQLSYKPEEVKFIFVLTWHRITLKRFYYKMLQAEVLLC